MSIRAVVLVAVVIVGALCAFWTSSQTSRQVQQADEARHDFSDSEPSLQTSPASQAVAVQTRILLRGDVRTTTGGPIESAIVYALADVDPVLATTVSDASGRWKLHLGSDHATRWLGFVADGYLPMHVDLRDVADLEDPISAVLKRPQVRSIAVTALGESAPSGLIIISPPRSTKVSDYPRPGEARVSRLELFVEAGKRREFSFPVAGRLLAMAEWDRGALAPTPVSMGHTELLLRPSARISVELREMEGGAPAEGEATLNRDGSAADEGVLRFDSDGAVTWDSGVRPGTYEVHVRSRQFEPWTSKVTVRAEGDLVQLRARLQRRRDLSQWTLRLEPPSEADGGLWLVFACRVNAKEATYLGRSGQSGDTIVVALEDAGPYHLVVVHPERLVGLLVRVDASANASRIVRAVRREARYVDPNKFVPAGARITSVRAHSKFAGAFLALQESEDDPSVSPLATRFPKLGPFVVGDTTLHIVADDSGVQSTHVVGID